MHDTDPARRPALLRKLLSAVITACVAFSMFAGCAGAPAQPDPAPVSSAEPQTRAFKGFWGSSKATTIDAPFLWKIEGDNGPVYLFGTVHMGVDAEDELPKVVWDSLNASETYVMEADISAVNPMKVLSYARLPKGESLPEMLDPEVWEGLKKSMAMLPEEMLKQSKPWFINIALIQQNFPQTASMDQTLMEHAKQQGKALGFLEGWEEQIQMLDDLPHAYSIDSINEAIQAPETFQAEIQRLLDVYRGGDAAEMAALLLDNEELKKYPKVTQEMFDNRNARWVPQIEAHVKTGKVFVATGLGHLVGEGSVIDLLRQKGYKIERIR